MPAASPNAKRGKKLLKWIFIFGIAAVAAILALVVLVLSDPRVQKFVTLATESRRIVKKGEDAPGAKEVRAAGGCQLVSIDDLGELAALGQQMLDGGGPPDALPTGTVVVCIMPSLRATPSCDVLADAYVDAAHPTKRFFVSVRRLGTSESTCTEGYDAAGNRLPKRSKK